MQPRGVGTAASIDDNAGESSGDSRVRPDPIAPELPSKQSRKKLEESTGIRANDSCQQHISQ
ncbi:protein of unknown function [Candidatus Filomicrobium marinum]|uniref:Uncharacterized protein n=1 Tax=Candidatus Filomicrobium marinum TaxID=1608628 RepID=A0A0D6JDH3_9HYPH|nr:protein of unknown function [Candidatus Filomicrobium marinum]CPR17649.1 protein of unknown function [Candidatus Filomicrobium marinum]